MYISKINMIFVIVNHAMHGNVMYLGRWAYVTWNLKTKVWYFLPEEIAVYTFEKFKIFQQTLLHLTTLN